jgi:hypothetical protein
MSSNLWTHKHPVALNADAIEKKKRQDSQAALIFALLIGAFAAIGIFLSAHSVTPQEPSQVSDCTGVEPKAARLVCFDKLARDAETPFKGAPPAHLDGTR